MRLLSLITRPLCLAVLASSLLHLCAQSSQLVQGLMYYVVEDRAQNQVVRRGTTGYTGIAIDQLILSPNNPNRNWL